MIILEKSNYDAFICNIAKKFTSEVFGKPHTLTELFGWFFDGFINFPVISMHMIMRHFMCFCVVFHRCYVFLGTPIFMISQVHISIQEVEDTWVAMSIGLLYTPIGREACQSLLL